MLKAVRNNMQLVIWIVLVAFLIGIAGSAVMSRQAVPQSMGIVFGKRISQQEFGRVYKSLYFSPGVQAQIREKGQVDEKTLIDSTFQQIAFLKEAEKRKIKVSDEELQEEIVRRFSYEGSFNPQLYKGWIERYARMDVHDYEEGVRRELMVRKLIESVRNSVTISDEEVEEYYLKENRKLKIAYISRPYTEEEAKINTDNDKLVEYYQSNLDAYKTEKKYSIEYVLVDPTEFAPGIEVSEEEMTNYFNENKSSFKDPEADKEPVYEDVKARIKDMLIQQKATERAKQVAAELESKITEAIAFRSIAAETGRNVEALSNATVEKVTETLGWSFNLKRVLDETDSTKLSSVDTGKGTVLFRVTGVQTPKPVPFQESAEKVKADYINAESKKLAKETLQEIKTKMINVEDFSTIAEESGYSVKEIDFFNYKKQLDTDEISARIIFNEMWDDEIGAISEPLTFEKNAVLVKLLEVQDPATDDKEKQKEEIRTRLSEFRKYFETQGKLSEILKEANIQKKDGLQPML